MAGPNATTAATKYDMATDSTTLVRRVQRRAKSFTTKNIQTVKAINPTASPIKINSVKSVISFISYWLEVALIGVVGGLATLAAGLAVLSKLIDNTWRFWNDL